MLLGFRRTRFFTVSARSALRMSDLRNTYAFATHFPACTSSHWMSSYSAKCRATPSSSRPSAGGSSATRYGRFASSAATSGWR